MAVRPEVAAERRDALVKLFEGALAGRPRPLYDFLARHSSLPGPRANEGLLDEFAEIFGNRGKEVDRLLETMATLDADLAQGGTEFEFVPMCGVMALGVRGARDERAYPRVLGVLHACADDLRFRVRDTVPRALARIGATRGDVLLSDVEAWMDGFFHAAAVLRAMGTANCLTTLTDAGLVKTRLDEAFQLAAKAPRSASRYPGYKALVDALSEVPGLVAGRFGVIVFDALEGWTREKEPVLREAIEKNFKSPRLVGRHANEIDRVRRALDSTAPPRRDPTTYVGPTRNRSKTRKI